MATIGYMHAMATTLQQLSDLQARIDDIETKLAAAGGSSGYSIGGRSLTRQALTDLRDERTRLVREWRQVKAVLEGARSPGEAVAAWY